MVLKQVIFVLRMQFAEASYLFVVTMKTFNRIALGHTYICCMKYILETTIQHENFRWHTHFWLSQLLYLK